MSIDILKDSAAFQNGFGFWVMFRIKNKSHFSFCQLHNYDKLLHGAIIYYGLDPKNYVAISAFFNGALDLHFLMAPRQDPLEIESSDNCSSEEEVDTLPGLSHVGAWTPEYPLNPSEKPLLPDYGDSPTDSLGDPKSPEKGAIYLETPLL